MKVSDLVKTGIPVRKAQFHTAVNNSDGVPENYFSNDSNAVSRRVKMWWTPHGIICFHKEDYFTVPLGTVMFAFFEKEIEIERRLSEPEDTYFDSDGLVKKIPAGSIIEGSEKRGRPLNQQTGNQQTHEATTIKKLGRPFKVTEIT